jgi:hypothetical protein
MCECGYLLCRWLDLDDDEDHIGVEAIRQEIASLDEKSPVVIEKSDVPLLIAPHTGDDHHVHLSPLETIHRANFHSFTVKPRSLQTLPD